MKGTLEKLFINKSQKNQLILNVNIPLIPFSDQSEISLEIDNQN